MKKKALTTIPVTKTIAITVPTIAALFKTLLSTIPAYQKSLATSINNSSLSNVFSHSNSPVDGVLSVLSPFMAWGIRCPPGRQYVSTGILLVLIDPNNIQRGQNDVNAAPPNDNQLNYAVITDAPL